MTHPYTFAQSATFNRIVALLQQEPLSVAELAERAHCCIRHADKIAKHLHREMKQIHVSRWARNANSGPFKPIYAWGERADSRRPVPYTTAQKCKRYRQALRARLGQHYKTVHEMQRESVPGRRLIVEGQVVYQQ